MIEFDLTEYSHLLRIEDNDYERVIFDPIRKITIKLQPEELVRQTWIQYLLSEKSISPSALSVERMIKVGDLSKRFDLVLYEKALPRVLFEFKSFNVKLDALGIEQAAIYNKSLQAPYLVLSNGVQHFACKIDHLSGKVRHMESLDFLS